MNKQAQKVARRARIKARVRSRATGTAERPRLSVFRSNRFMYAQLIDDTRGVTLGAASDMKETSGTKVERAQKVGEAIAAIAKKQNITRVVFDRNGFSYTGRVEALATAARDAGLAF